MDSKTIFTKTAKGLMEATGKTSVLSRDLRSILKEIDGKATVGEVQKKFGAAPEAKLQEALKVLARSDFIREFTQAARTAAPPPSPAAGEIDLDFTVSIPTIQTQARKAEEAAKQQAQAAAAAAEAAARAKAEAEARAKAAAAEAAARARAEAEARARTEAEERAKTAAAEAAARARAEAEARAKRDAEERARREAEERSRVEAELKARLEEERKARDEAERKAKERVERERKEVEEKARREADELRAKLEEERKARDEAERKAKERVERERKEAEEKARREADELRAKLEEERRAREEAERKAKEEAERERKEAEEKARREADELRAKLEEERRARDEAERKAKEEAERRAREEADRLAREAAEKTRAEAIAKARQEAEDRARREAAERARKDAEEKARKEAADNARREAEERERREAEERARKEAEQKREAEEQARKDAEAREQSETEEQVRQRAAAKPGPSLEELVKVEIDLDAAPGSGGGAKQEAAKIRAGEDEAMLKLVEERARKEAGEKARIEAEERRRREAEDKAKPDEEERRRKDKEEQERKLAEDKARAEAEAREREYAEAQARLDARNEETERHFAEMEKELEAEQAAVKVEKKPSESSHDARKRDKEEARARARAEAGLYARAAETVIDETPTAYRTPVNWGKPVALGLFLIMILGLVLIHFVSFDGYIPQFEKLAGGYLQQPVKIKALHLSLVPLPHWRLDGVSVGGEGELAVERINAVAELGSMFSDKKAFKSIELESPVLSEEGLIALLFGKSQGQDFKVASVIVKNGKLDSKIITLPTLDAKVALGEDGAWQKIAFETPDHKTSLQLEPRGEVVQLEVETNAFSMPFSHEFILENFVASGVLGRNEIKLSEFKGGIFGGYLSGNAGLKWGADWSLGGEFSVRAMDPGRIAPALVEAGKLEGKATYAMRAKTYDVLFAAPRMEGSFSIQKGTFLGVDLGRLLQGGAVGGKTAFAELSGNFVHEGGKTQLRQVHLVSGPVSASGSADADASKHINGRFAVELKSPVAQARANLAVSGTLREPRFNR